MQKLLRAAKIGRGYGRMALRRLGLRGLCSGRASILMYHRVLPAAQMSASCSSRHIIVSDTDFAHQMKILAKSCNLVSLRQLGTMITQKSPNAIPANTVCVTFDDGWDDNYTHAFPVLTRYSIPATIFLTTDFMEQERSFWQEHVRHFVHAGRRLQAPCLQYKHIVEVVPEMGSIFQDNDFTSLSADAIARQMKQLKKSERNTLVTWWESCLTQAPFPISAHRMMSWNQVQEMAEAGIEMGSHTMSHSHLTRLDQDVLRAEFTQSRLCIEEHIQQQVHTVAYPHGDVNENVAETARESGYEVGVTTQERYADSSDTPMLLPRLNMNSHRFQGVSPTMCPIIFKGFAGI